MNYIDIVIILLILLTVYIGWVRGFLTGAMDVMRWIGCLLLAFRSYPHVNRWIENNVSTDPVWTYSFSFLFTFLIANVLLYLLQLVVLRKIPGHVHCNKVNKALGILPGVINGIVLSAIASVTLLALPLKDEIRNETRNSKLIDALEIPAGKLETIFSPILEKSVEKTLNNLTLQPQSEKFIKLKFTVENAAPNMALEAAMLNLINEERRAEGLEPLRPDPELRHVARNHSRDMFRRGYFSHLTPEGKNPFERIKKAGVSFSWAGENLALAPTLSIAHRGLMASPGHRANILKKEFGRVGIGVLDGGIRGLMITQNFRN